MLSGSDAEQEDAKRRLRAVLVELPEAATTKDQEKEIRALLLEIGVRDNLKGYDYIIEAIRLVLKDSSVLDAIIKELYPQIANKFGATPPRVERGIRHSIETAWDNGNLDVLYKLFGNTVSAYSGKPVNSLFIARCANIIKERMEVA